MLVNYGLDLGFRVLVLLFRVSVFWLWGLGLRLFLVMGFGI